MNMAPPGPKTLEELLTRLLQGVDRLETWRRRGRRGSVSPASQTDASTQNNGHGPQSAL